jgi:intein/homing endonuclease
MSKINQIFNKLYKDKKSSEAVNIIDFIKAPWGLSPPKSKPFRPFPAQTLILKAHYGIPLDNSYVFQIPKSYRKRQFYTFTEQEFLQYLYDQGRCNIFEIEEGHERRDMVLSLGRRSGKCVATDEVILTDRGMLKAGTLGDLNGEEYQPLKIGVIQESYLKSESAFFYNGGVRDTITYKTDHGYSLQGTPNHRVRVMTEEGTVQWKYLEDLKSGDYVGILPGTNLWSNESVTLENGVNLDPRLAKIAGENFGDEVIQGGFQFLSKKFGILSCIMRSPKTVVQGFIDGLQSRIYEYKNAAVLDVDDDYKDLQLLLLNADLPTRYYNGKLLFLNPSTVGMESLPFEDELIPHQKSILPECLHHFLEECGSLSYDALYQILTDESASDAHRDHLISLRDMNYIYDQVVSVEASQAVVCDLNVPKGNAFVCNGAVNHNTTITAAIAAYEVYKLLEKGSPQSYYGAPEENMIHMVVVATNKKQASLLYKEASGNFAKSCYFNPFMAKNTQSYAQFQTPKNIEDYGSFKDDKSARSGIELSFFPCNPNSLRGLGCIMVIMDEAAHFANTGNATAKEMIDVARPAMLQYSPKDENTGDPTGPVESRMIMISSPMGKQGNFYAEFRRGFDHYELSKNHICFQAPTWEVNSTVQGEFLINEYRKDPRTFWVEYGARFDVSERNWIESVDDILACVDKGRKAAFNAPAKMPHFIGIDVGLVNDYTALAIGHLDDKNNIVIDVVDRIRAGEGRYVGKERLTLEDVVTWLSDYCKRFHIVGGYYDQHLGNPFEDALVRRGITQFDQLTMTRGKISEVFKNFQTLLYEGRIRFYNDVEKEGDLEDYILELSRLVATPHSKYITTVEAPNVKDAYDDMSDALVRMVYMATENFGKKKYITKGTSRGSNDYPSGESKYKTARRYTKGGSHPSRHIPTKKRNRWNRK